MVNICIKPSGGFDMNMLSNQICEALRGNRGFIENDIVVSAPYRNESAGSILISLGDDADVNPRKVDLIVTVREIYDNGE